MLLPLESFDKIRKASLALEFRDLIGIAAYSVSPSTAYKVAQRLEWRRDKAMSCKYLAMILRDYGSRAFRKLVAKTNPKDYQDLCLCDCHLGNWELKMFLENGDDDWEWDCDCDCCNHTECFHAAHTFNYDCEFCNNDGGDESEDENNATAEDEEDYHAEERKDEEIRKPPTRSERLKEISERIARVSGERRAIKEVHDIEGDKMQAQAVQNDADYPIEVTNLLIDELSDDELAWVIAHENAHIEHKDGQRTGTAIDESAERVKVALMSLDKRLKEKGHGFIGRTLAQVITGAVGVASMYVNTKQTMREHENEADERAIEIIQKAGYDPSASISAMRKLSRRGSMYHNGIIEAITSTHPSPHERIENLEKKKKDEEVKAQ